MAESKEAKGSPVPPTPSPLLSPSKGLLSSGSPLRSLKKKLSLPGLSVRSRRASPDRGDGTRPRGHVPGTPSPLSQGRRQSLRPLSVTGEFLPFDFDVTREMDLVESEALSFTADDVTSAISPDPTKKITQTELPVTPSFTPSSPTDKNDSEETVKPVAGSPQMAPKPEQNSSPTLVQPSRKRFDQDRTEDKGQRVIKEDSESLTKMSPPDLSQHPASKTQEGEADQRAFTSMAPPHLTEPSAFKNDDQGQSGVVKDDSGSLTKLSSPDLTQHPAFNTKDKDLPVIPSDVGSRSRSQSMTMMPPPNLTEHLAFNPQGNGQSLVTGNFGALAETSPPDLTQHPAFQDEEENPAVVTGDFRSLTTLQAPDISQHPALQANPLSARSDAPLMITTSTAEEIHRWRREKDRKKQESEHGNRVRFDTNTVTYPASRNAFAPDNNTTKGKMEENPFTAYPVEGQSSPVYRRPIFPRASAQPELLRTTISRLQIDTSDKAETTGDNIAARSPKSATSPPPKSSSESIKPALTPISDGLEQKKSGLRRVTDIFKPKGTEKPEVYDPCAYFDVPRADLELRLRKTANCYTSDYNPLGALPRHPHTARAWKSRNLRCTTCTDKCCAVCGRACCAYKAAANAMQTHKDNPESLHAARDRLFQITAVFPYGVETPTFLQCTKGGEIGCGKTVCPDCCGICPNLYCQDTQCRKCKKDPWSECLWHDEFMNRRAL